MSDKIRLLCFLLLCGYTYSYGCKSNNYIKDAGPMVRTASGSVIGTYVKVFDTNVAAFLGIPYAEPPVNELRFQKPKPVENWKGILEATKKPSPCMQYSSRDFAWIPKTTTRSEDCLYLNVWAPVKCCCTDQERLSVLVWIHGGGFYSGSTDMDVYDGRTLAAYSNSIVVTMNYRLGIFGFLNSGTEQAPGNAGLLDQNLALKWIKKNIEYFGGDPESITIMGESAGAMSVSLHMVSPMSRNLFNRAIMQSGSSYHPLMIDTAAVSYVKANAYAGVVGCVSDNSSIELNPKIVECLKNKDAFELAKTEDVFTSKFPMYFIPSYTNEFLPISPLKAFSEGDIAPVDVLTGNTKDEVSIFLNYIIPDIFKVDSEPQLNMQAAEQIMAALFQTAPAPPFSDIFSRYFQNVTGEDSSEIVRTIIHAFGDYSFYCPMQYLAEKSHSAYVYWLTHRSTRAKEAEWMGVPHFYEVPFLFGAPIHDTDTYSPEDGKFSWDLIKIWTAFAHEGHSLPDKKSEDWPLFTADQPNVFELNPREGGALPFPRASACEFWRPYIVGEKHENED